ncbi:MAG: hypothetical protein WC979_04410 [Candidatus Pacearchaeota archaeon]|jgi:hypothetical protein
MSWFSKKESVSPDRSLLPDLPSSPAQNPNQSFGPEDLSAMDLPQMEINELSASLPPIPSKNVNEMSSASSRQDNFEMQKSEFQPISPPEGYNGNLQQTNKPQLKPLIQPKTQQRVEPKSKPRVVERDDDDDVYQRRSSKKEPVYIRLDKFETTLDAFEEIKSKVNEIEKLLVKSKQIKVEEEKELEEGEKEIHLIREKLDSIDKNIFNKFS